jgi:hypothetical protein
MGNDSPALSMRGEACGFVPMPSTQGDPLDENASTAWTALVAALALLAGCAQPAKKQSFDRERAKSLKTLVLAQRPNQDAYLLNIHAMPGGADEKSKSDRLTKAIDPAETRLQERFSAKLQQKLAAAGYETRLVVLPSIPSTDDELLAQVKAKGMGGDAVLAIGMFGEYAAAGPASEYLPKIGVSVRVVDTNSGALLYQDSLAYCFTLAQSDADVLPCDPRYRFQNIDTLVADPAKAREGLIAGLDPLAARVAADLRRN